MVWKVSSAAKAWLSGSQVTNTGSQIRRKHPSTPSQVYLHALIHWQNDVMYLSMVLERPNALCAGVHVGSDARREAWERRGMGMDQFSGDIPTQNLYPVD